MPKKYPTRLLRSQNQPLRLIHRTNSHFFILGATGNVYTVTLSVTPTCNCPDPTIPCKHILFLYIRVFSVAVNDPCIHRHTLTPFELTRLLSAKVSDESLAGDIVRQRFLELYRLRNQTELLAVKLDDGDMRPVCLDQTVVGDRRVVTCTTCKNRICHECLSMRRGVSYGYINLSEYVIEDASSDSSSESEDEYEGYEDENELVEDDPPTNPRYIYKTVRLPARVETLLNEVVEATKLQGRRIERLEDLMQWHLQLEIERARVAGFEPPPLPPPREYSKAP